MKIIHCSDLHLDSKLDTTLSPDMAKARNYELSKSFYRMVEYAHKHNVQVIMICGDLFESSSPKVTTVQFILSVIKKYPHITFLYLRGNHDEQIVFSDQTLPSNLKLFDKKWRYYQVGQVIFAGIEFDEYNYASLYDSLQLSNETTNIVMMLGQIGSKAEQYVINLSAFSKYPVDYLALGHIHRHNIQLLPPRGKWCYSGCLEGRGFDETGKKGFVLLDIAQQSVHTTFVPFSTRVHHKMNLDITDIEEISDIIEQIKYIISEIPSKDSIRITLTGTRSASEPIDIDFIEQIFKESFYHIDFQNAIRYTYEHELLDDVIGLKKAFIRNVQNDNSLCENEVLDIIELGLKAMRGEEILI